jgi:hypothetical protein
MSKHKKPYDRTVHRLREIARIIKRGCGLYETDDGVLSPREVRDVREAACQSNSQGE